MVIEVRLVHLANASRYAEPRPLCWSLWVLGACPGMVYWATRGLLARHGLGGCVGSATWVVIAAAPY